LPQSSQFQFSKFSSKYFLKRSERDVTSPSAGLLGKTGKEVAISGRELEEETVFGASTACHQLVKHVSSSAGRELEEETVFGAQDDGASQTTLKAARNRGAPRPAHTLEATTSLRRHSPNIPLGGH